jgi:hypothetical protein
MVIMISPVLGKETSGWHPFNLDPCQLVCYCG